MKLSDFGLCKPVDVSKLPTLHEEDVPSPSRSGLPGLSDSCACCGCHAMSVRTPHVRLVSKL